MGVAYYGRLTFVAARARWIIRTKPRQQWLALFPCEEWLRLTCYEYLLGTPAFVVEEHASGTRGLQDPAISLLLVLFSQCLLSRGPRCCLRCIRRQIGFLPYKCSLQRFRSPLSQAASSSQDNCGSEPCQRIRVNTVFQPGLNHKGHYPRTKRTQVPVGGLHRTFPLVHSGVLQAFQGAQKPH